MSKHRIITFDLEMEAPRGRTMTYPATAFIFGPDNADGTHNIRITAVDAPEHVRLDWMAKVTTIHKSRVKTLREVDIDHTL